MYPEEITLLDATFIYLSEATASPSRKPSTSLSSAQVDAIASILERWPSSQLFPVVDLSRLVVGFCPDVFSSQPELRDKLTESLFKAVEWSASWTPPLAKVRETNTLLLLRTLANVFGDVGKTDVDWLRRILETLAQAPYKVLNKTQRVALATVLFK